ncbi:MAG: phosphoribosylglycinamide formyltransferase [Egibacteraceae bacterium]
MQHRQDPWPPTTSSGSAKRIAVLVSGEGTNLQTLLDAGNLGGQIVLVGADRPDAYGLVRAEKAGVDTVVVPFGEYGVRDEWDAALFAHVAEYAPDLVVLAGFMRILHARWVERWPMLNTHPALLPAFPGPHAVRDALAYGVKVTGATVHFVIEEVDAGPIVLQEPVRVWTADTENTLHERIKAVEHRLLLEAVALFCHGRLEVEGRVVRVRT